MSTTAARPITLIISLERQTDQIATDLVTKLIHAENADFSFQSFH
jgi:hypothetical protein